MTESSCKDCKFTATDPQDFPCSECSGESRFMALAQAPEIIETTDPLKDDAHLSTAIGYLDNAASEMRDRATSYDSPDGERSMGKAVAALNAIAGDDMARNGVRECHGWLLLELVKHVRQYANGPHQDSAVDSVAYAALHAEARMGEAKN